jgi:hypothetical protein
VNFYQKQIRYVILIKVKKKKKTKAYRMYSTGAFTRNNYTSKILKLLLKERKSNHVRRRRHIVNKMT